MSLVTGKPVFKAGYIQLQKDMLTRNAESFDEAAERMADLIIELMKSADVKAGIAVSTAGSATAQTGQTTAKGKLE